MPTTTANYVAARDNTKEDINVRSAGWCSDWPSGSTWMPPVLGSTNPDKTNSFGSNYAAFSNAVDATTRWTPSRGCRWTSRRPPGTPWTSRSPTKYFPLFTTYYTGIAQAHGSKIQGD